MTELPEHISNAVNRIPAQLVILCNDAEGYLGEKYRKGMAAGIACSSDYYRGSPLLQAKDKDHWAAWLTAIENLIIDRMNKLVKEGALLDRETGELISAKTGKVIDSTGIMT